MARPSIRRTTVAATLIVCFAGTSMSSLAANTGWQTTASTVITRAATSQRGIRNQTTASADVVAQRTHGQGTWLGHIEVNTTPQINRISGFLPEANADVGTALNKNNKGRVQLSELYYTHHFSDSQSVSAGLMDVSGFFEQSRIASDETTQFLGAFFVGNPTIAFPDYTLGLAYQQALSDGVVLRAALASSEGLADNPERSYSQLFTVDENEGAFGIASASWQVNRWLLRAGTWLNTASHHPLDSTRTDEANYGAYLLAGYEQGRHAVNIRLGFANPQVSLGAAFASVGYRNQQGRYTVGAGYATARLSHQSPDRALDDTQQLELFLRYQFNINILLTGHVQRIINSNFGLSFNDLKRDASVYSMRFTWLYP